MHMLFLEEAERISYSPVLIPDKLHGQGGSICHYPSVAIMINIHELNIRWLEWSTYSIKEQPWGKAIIRLCHNAYY